MIRELLWVVGCLVVLLVYFAAERVVLSHRLRRIPLRIGVAGIRGKSSITRLIAGGMREAGLRVLAKTTGSQPVLIHPDGHETEIHRPDSPTILEVKKLLKQASEYQVDAVICELMSIDPECLYAESVQILEPQILVMTNFRLDHMAQLGTSRKDMALSLAAAIPAGATVFLPREESLEALDNTTRAMGSQLILVPEKPELSGELRADELEVNRRLALAVTERAGIDEETATRGMLEAKPDFGSLKLWRLGEPPARRYLISAFAANDPESTREALNRIGTRKELARLPRSALLNLRRDRGDRTLQWLEALQSPPFSELEQIFLLGDHGRAALSRSRRRGERRLVVLEQRAPDKIMQEVVRATRPDTILVGMGNMGGVGRELVRHWERTGEAL